MSLATIYLTVPEPLADFVRGETLHGALRDLALRAGLELTICDSENAPPAPANNATTFEIPIRYREQVFGRVNGVSGGDATEAERAATSLVTVLEHLLERELAVNDLAEAMLICYDEQNMFYSLLPNIRTKIHPKDIGEAIVEEAARTLNCRRVSLLVLDENQSHLKLLASHGLPQQYHHVRIPLDESIAGRAILDDEFILVNDLTTRPELEAMSHGGTTANAFAVVRVPLHARGEPIGVLTATERCDGQEFTARDRKLLEGLSAIGASALLNCRLHRSVNNQMMGTIRSLASAVDAKDSYTHNHTSRVAELCVEAAVAVGIDDPQECREIELAGLLHDIGKIGIPDAILCKAGPLTPEEYKIIKDHVRIGADIVNHVEGLDRVATAILHHHERYDGLGYPAGLAGNDIPLASKLIAIVDTYDALTTDRPYRAGATPKEAISEIRKFAGTQFDPELVETFIGMLKQQTPEPAMA